MMTRARTFAALVVALAAAAGCTKERTETVVVVATDGVRVPDDFDAINLRVADTTDVGNPVFEKSFRICGGDVTDNCLTVPLDFTLIPGPHRDHSSRVQVTATRKTMPVIDNAAIFTFAEGQSLRLDFVLYANCLGNVDCAVRDQACGPDAMCHPVPAVPISGEPDLAFNAPDLGGGGDDLSTPIDLSMSIDLAMSIDLSIPIDLATHDLAMPDLATVDMATSDMATCIPTCAPGYCGPSNCPATQCFCSGLTICQANSCNACGSAGDPCCASPNPPCQGSLHCFGSAPGICQPADMATSSSDGGAGDQVLTWSSMTFDSGTFYSIWGLGTSTYAVGDQGAMANPIWKRASGAPFSFAPDSGNINTTTMRSVWGASKTSLWATGDSGRILQLSGGTWSTAIGNPQSYTQHGIWIGGPGSPTAYVVGGDISGNCMDKEEDAQWDGSMWVHHGTGTMACAQGAVWSDGAGGSVFASNEFHVDWSTDAEATQHVYQLNPTSNAHYLHGVWGSSMSNVYFVGDAGTIYRFDVNGGTPQSTQEGSNTVTDLASVHGSSASDVWAVGGNVVLHSTGNGTWTPQTNLPPASLSTYQAVFAIAPNDVYVVGSKGGAKLILHGQ